MMSATEDDLTADYARAARRLLPRGAAWPVDDPDSAMARFWAGLARELARWHLRDEALVIESDPGASTELLTDWERVLGLPDDCMPVAATVGERRQAVVARLTALGGQSPAFFEALGTALGYETTVEERRPFTCGVSECGGTHELIEESLRFDWFLRVAGPRVVHFHCGEGECGVTALTDYREATDLNCLVQRFKPAHTQSTLIYEG
jgi:uncharacterized protein YmfQ (DUF2313 family)